MKTSRYDNATYSLIRKLLLLQKNKPRNFTPMDERFLKLLINGKIDYE